MKRYGLNEQVSNTMMYFNLSSEQWDELAPLIQQALTSSYAQHNSHAALVEALEELLSDRADIEFGEERDLCRFCGIDYTDENAEAADEGSDPFYFCLDSACIGNKARAALALAKQGT